MRITLCTPKKGRGLCSIFSMFYCLHNLWRQVPAVLPGIRKTHTFTTQIMAWKPFLKQTGYHHSNDRLGKYSDRGVLYYIRKVTLRNLYNLLKITNVNILKWHSCLIWFKMWLVMLTMQNFLWIKLKFILHWILEKLDQFQ